MILEQKYYHHLKTKPTVFFSKKNEPYNKLHRETHPEDLKYEVAFESTLIKFQEGVTTDGNQLGGNFRKLKMSLTTYLDKKKVKATYLNFSAMGNLHDLSIYNSKWVPFSSCANSMWNNNVLEKDIDEIAYSTSQGVSGKLEVAEIVEKMGVVDNYAGLTIMAEYDEKFHELMKNNDNLTFSFCEFTNLTLDEKEKKHLLEVFEFIKYQKNEDLPYEELEEIEDSKFF